jgi:hypothetical protein
MHEVIIPYQHCTVLNKIIAGRVCFYVDNVMLMQQSRPVSFMVTTSNGAAGAAGMRRQWTGRAGAGPAPRWASESLCIMPDMYDKYVFVYVFICGAYK